MLTARSRMGLTQEEVAGLMGTTKSAVSRLEATGKHTPSLTTLKKYAQAVGCQLEIKLVPKRTRIKRQLVWARSRRRVKFLTRDIMETSPLKIIGSVPWREAFPEYREEDLPGVSLLGARTKEGMIQTRLSELTGIPQRHLSMMEHGKRPIGKKNARLLAKVLNVDYRVFL